MDQIEIRSPKTEAEWKKYDDFRWEILRKPLNIPHIPLKDDLEDKSYHFMAITSSNEIVACGRLHMNNDKEAQIDDNKNLEDDKKTADFLNGIMDE